MLTKRIIPCLDVRDGKVVKGVQFRDHRVVGDIVDLARAYEKAGADELVFYDITASTEARTVDLSWVGQVARQLSIPFCVAGGIRTVQDARTILFSGADKISINSPALERPELITELANEFGTQCVVVGVDSSFRNGEYEVYAYTGNETSTQKTRWKTMDWLQEVQNRGAGEIVLNCMDRDGTQSGYDLDQLKRARSVAKVPLVASGGARSVDHFEAVFQEVEVDAALAASIFHSGQVQIQDLKAVLKKRGVSIRA